MTQFNPLAGAVLPSAQAQRQQAAERVSHVRRSQETRKNAAHQPGDTFEHQVESSDALAGVHDEERHQPDRNRKNPKSPDEDENNPSETGADDADSKPRLDLTA